MDAYIRSTLGVTMAGILYSSGDMEGIEASGVYKGIIQEDMIETVRRVKKPFIDVFIEKMFFEDADYPLTYVPMFNMVLPLKKDQEVWVYFNQENHRYPVLWKLADDFKDGSGYLKDFDMPSDGGLVVFPKAEETAEVFKISDSVWFITTKSFGVLHYGEQCVLLNGDSIITNAKGSFNAIAGEVNIEARGNGLVGLGNKTDLLGDLAGKLFDILKSFQTTGSSTQQATSPATLLDLIALQNRWAKVFKKNKLGLLWLLLKMIFTKLFWR